MPELPDVEVFRRILARSSLHRTIEGVRVTDTRMLRDVEQRTVRRQLRGRSLEAARRHGKHLVADLSGDGVLVLHFGMTGHLATGEGRLEFSPHARFVLEFEDGHWLVLVDQRRLGRVALADGLEEYVAREGLGPDALALDVSALRNLLHGSRAGVKATLMDQGRIAGLGNIYTDEVLFQARVDPTAAARRLDDAAYRRVHRQLRRVVELAVKRGADPARLPRTWLLPHREDGAPCPRGQGTIRRFTSGGRTGYWCPACQGG
jgi:formamidopyrimidine-DNA glycosylase